MGEKRNWTFDAGEDWIIDLTCYEADGKTPLDLTAAQVLTRLGLDGELAGEIAATVQSPATAGVARIVVAEADQPPLTPDQVLTYTARAVLSDGRISDQLFGAITVRPNEFGL